MRLGRGVGMTTVATRMARRLVRLSSALPSIRGYSATSEHGENILHALRTSSWSHLRWRGDKPRIAVAMSGGVDSSVAAYVLKEQGCDVFGIYMRTWDELEEGESECAMREDRDHARMACDHLSIPFVEVDLIAEYWHSVFEPYLDKFKLGLTPNPDLYCNQFVKFGTLMDHAGRLGADGLATGHFARLRERPHRDPLASGGAPALQLLRGSDPAKDQTYFLSRVSQGQLRRAAFPVGAMTKDEVRCLASAIGLPNASKKSSSGICFIGKRRFSRFLEQYIRPTPGDFVSVEGDPMGRHEGFELFTRGQRSRIETGGRGAFFVVGKDVETKVVYVAENRDHPSQFSRGAFLKSLHWIESDPPREYLEKGGLACSFKARYLEEDTKCTLFTPGTRVADEPTRFYRCDDADSDEGLGLYAEFEAPHAAITPEQAMVFYQGEVCLGSALIHRPGRTLHEE